MTSVKMVIVFLLGITAVAAATSSECTSESCPNQDVQSLLQAKVSTHVETEKEMEMQANENELDLDMNEIEEDMKSTPLTEEDYPLTEEEAKSQMEQQMEMGMGMEEEMDSEEDEEEMEMMEEDMEDEEEMEMGSEDNEEEDEEEADSEEDMAGHMAGHMEEESDSEEDEEEADSEEDEEEIGSEERGFGGRAGKGRRKKCNDEGDATKCCTAFGKLCETGCMTVGCVRPPHITSAEQCAEKKKGKGTWCEKGKPVSGPGAGESPPPVSGGD